MIIEDVITPDECEFLLRSLVEKYPQILISNNYIEVEDDSLDFITLIPKINLSNIGQPLCLILLSTVSADNTYAGEEWHIDGASDETTVILYLNGDNTSGGEFLTKTDTYKFKPRSMIVLPSHRLHKVNPYNNKNARIAVKWKFK